MSLDSALSAGRRAAEARMLDTFEIRRPTGGYTMVDGVETPASDLIFTTPGRVKVSGGLAVRDAEVGERTSASVVRVLNIPVGSQAVRTGDIAVCTAVHETSDPSLLNARLRLDGPAPGSQTTARRLQVTEVLS